MPSYADHIDFVESRPYEAWYFIQVGIVIPCMKIVGACYLSRQDEIGVFVFSAERGHGYGRKAVQAIIWKHGERRYLANINPQNERSIKLFEKLDFKPVQHTYARSIPSRP